MKPKTTNPLQFAVVREDPQIELELFQKYKPQHALMVGSGGCTALSLQARFPKVPLTLVDPNPEQIRLIKLKMDRLKKGARVDDLIEGGNFESLFHCFREFLFEFVADKTVFEKWFKKSTSRQWQTLFKNPYWRVAFRLHFSHDLLLAIFGPAAIQHAPPESYAKHFQTVLERGLLRPDRSQNYFLHHVFLGRYLENKRAWPPYMQHPPKSFNINFIQARLDEIRDFAFFDFIGLSNIFDWSSTKEVSQLARRIATEANSGAVVVYRQLNNTKNFRKAFGPQIAWQATLGRKLHSSDRSLFYSSLHIGVKK